MKYWLYLIFASIAWGLNFHLAKVMLQSTNALEAGLWRYVFGVGVLLFFLWGDWPRWSVIRQHIKPLLLIGLAGLFGFNYCLFIGLTKTTAINAALIAGLTPALTLIASRIILKISITQAQIVGILLALFGVMVLILKGKLTSLLRLEFTEGDAWILLGNSIFALHNVWVRQYSDRMSNRHFTFLTNLICLLGFVLILPWLDFGSWSSYPGNFWLAAFGMGGIGTALAYFFWNKGIARVGAPQAGIFLNIIPFAAALFALLFGEQIHLYHLFSGLIIITGVIIMQLRDKQRIKALLGIQK
ncbi:MAG: EamA family transporter [Saprospiraceae bacterium]|nr:EamA family transporter [Lewinella sp.]